MILNRPKEGKAVQISYIDNLKKSKLTSNIGNMLRILVQKFQKVDDDDFLDNESAIESEFNFLNEDDDPKAVISSEEKGQISILSCNSSFSSILGFAKHEFYRKNITLIMSKKQSAFYYELSRKITKANKES